MRDTNQRNINESLDSIRKHLKAIEGQAGFAVISEQLGGVWTVTITEKGVSVLAVAITTDNPKQVESLLTKVQGLSPSDAQGSALSGGVFYA